MKISTSTNAVVRWLGEEGAIEALARAGFDGLDFGMFHLPPDGDVFANTTDGEFRAYFERIGNAAKKSKIAINQTHAPFPLKVMDEERDAVLMKCAIRSVYASAYMGAKYLVIHPIMPPGCIYGRNDGYAMQTNLEFFTALIPHLREAGVMLAVENMFGHDRVIGKRCTTVCSTAEEMCFYIDALNERAGGKLFVACLDTGHAVISGTGAADMLLKLGGRAEILHVQDGDGINDMHTVPGFGRIDFSEFAEAMKTVGYSGMFNFEADNFFTVFGKNLIDSSARMMCAIGHNIAG